MYIKYIHPLLVKRTYSYIRQYCTLEYANFKMNISNFESFKSIHTPELSVLRDIFSKYDHKLCLSGGPVRDILMGITPEDLDFATCATPDDMKKFFIKEEIRILNKNGEKHGTITVRINDNINYEVTTLRIDKVTDGRHAEVEFTKNWSLDAHRRDLTINSMFLDLEGNLYDFVGGKADLDQRKIRFVGDAETRIREDFLRILRYFRFYGKIAQVENGHDPDILHIIKATAPGLAMISGERIWIELKKICLGNYAPSLISLLFETQVSDYIGLPKTLNDEQKAELKRVCQRALPLLPNPISILTAVLRDFDDLKRLNQRLKFSNLELTIAAFIIDQRGLINTTSESHSPNQINGHTDTNGDYDQAELLKYFADLIVDSNHNHKCRDKIIEYIKYRGDTQLLEAFTSLQIPKFPITGYDLLNLGLPKSPKYAKILQDLRDRWKQSNFTLSRDKLLHELGLSLPSVSTQKTI